MLILIQRFNKNCDKSIHSLPNYFLIRKDKIRYIFNSLKDFREKRKGIIIIIITLKKKGKKENKNCIYK